MQVVRLTKSKNFTIVNKEKPNIGEKDVLIKINAVGICGSDLHRFRGVVFEEETNAGLVLGHEGAGTIIDVGDKVSHVKIGDKVAIEPGIHCGMCEWCLKGFPNLCPQIRFCGVPPQDGLLQEYISWPSHLVYKLPPMLDFDNGVMAEPMGICLYALDVADIKLGQTAAILGSGPIGLGIIHLLKNAAGLKCIFATELIPERCKKAVEMGADVVINGRENVVQKILHKTNNRGVDVVFEAAGEAATCEQSVQIAAPGGKVVFVGIPEDDKTPFATTSARRKGLTFLFLRRSRLSTARCLSLMEKGVINVKSMVTHHFLFSETQEAFDLVNNYRDGVIKAIINPDF